MSTSPASRQRLRRIPSWIAWCIFTGWLCGTAFAFWELEFRDLGRFETRADPQPPVAAAQRWFADHVHTNNAYAGITSGGSRAIVVQVVASGCRCNSYNDAHVTEVRESLRQSAVEFRRIERRGDDDGLDWIPTTPAAMVFDAGGRLAYFGPWSDSAWCGSDAGLVEPVVKRLLEGQAARPGPVRAGGCFCNAPGR